MVYATRSSSKTEESGSPNAHSLQTKGKASSSRKSTTSRRTRGGSTAEDQAKDTQESHEAVSFAVNSETSSQVDAQEGSAPSQSLSSTPSRHLRKKRPSDMGSCENSDVAEVQDTNVAKATLSIGKDEENLTPINDQSAKPAPTPGQRRRTSSSSSQNAPATPSRITRSMRKAGITTPKDVVELEIVQEEQPTEGKGSESLEEKGDESKSPLKSPGSEEHSKHPEKIDENKVDEESSAAIELKTSASHIRNVSSAELAVAVSLRTTVLSCISSEKTSKESAMKTDVFPESEKDGNVGENSLVISPSRKKTSTSSEELPTEDISLVKVVSASLDSSRRCSLTLKEQLTSKEIASKDVVLDVQNSEIFQTASATKSGSEVESQVCKSPSKQGALEESRSEIKPSVCCLPSKPRDRENSSTEAEAPICKTSLKESTPRKGSGFRSPEANPSQSPKKRPQSLDKSAEKSFGPKEMGFSQEISTQESSPLVASYEPNFTNNRKTRDNDVSISQASVDDPGDSSKKTTAQKSTPEIACVEGERIKKEPNHSSDLSFKKTKRDHNVDTPAFVTLKEKPANLLHEATMKSAPEVSCIEEESIVEKPVFLPVENFNKSPKSLEEEIISKEVEVVLIPSKANNEKSESSNSSASTPLKKPLTTSDEGLVKPASADIVVVEKEDTEKSLITKKADRQKNDCSTSPQRPSTMKAPTLSSEGAVEESLPDIVFIEQEDNEKSSVSKEPDLDKSGGTTSPRSSPTKKPPTSSNERAAEESTTDIIVIKQVDTSKIPLAAAKKEKTSAKKSEEELPSKEAATSVGSLQASHMRDEVENTSSFKPPGKKLPMSPVKKSTTEEAVQDAVIVKYDESAKETSLSPKKKIKKKSKKVEEEVPTERDSAVILAASPTDKSTAKEVVAVIAVDEEIPTEVVSSKKKSKKSLRKVEENFSVEKESTVKHVSQSKEGFMESVEATTTIVHSAESSEGEPRERRVKKLSKKTGELEYNDEDEGEANEVSSSKGNAKYVELETFKQLFKRPKFYGKSFKKAICALYAHSCSLNPRKNDLPVELICTDNETMWQFISFRCKQISKEYRKNSDLLDIDLRLRKEQSDSEDQSDSDRDEDETEEDHAYGEEEADLLNLKDEDLKDLDRELDEMRKNENQVEEQDENIAPRKKFPKSIVDDKFFSLAEMNAFLDEQDRMDNAASDILDTADDSWTGTADYCYEDFFGKEDRAGDTEDKKKRKKAKKRAHTDEPVKNSKKAKTVRFAVDEDADQDDYALLQEEDEEAPNEPVLLGEAKEQQQETSTLKKSLKRLKETIKKLEEENLAPKSWEMSGEVSAQQRGENELLETHVEFDYGMKKAPEITELFTEKLEDLIKQRIIDKAFDDVVRKKRIEERTEVYKNQAIEEREMIKTSLAEVYEKEYQKAAGEAKTTDKVNEQHAAIEKEMRDLFRLIDALSNFDYTPPEVRPEVRVVSNMPALRVEEVGMSASTDAQLLAPEEVKKHQKAIPKADDERDRTDKLRQRRKKKNRQRAMVELLGEEKAMEGLKKKKKLKNAENAEEKGEKLKSTTFFTKLQQTVRDEIRERTTKKKKKVKSQEVSCGGSKFML